MKLSFKLLQSCAICGLALSGSFAAAQTADDDEIIVRGQYLYNDQVNALKTPTPIIDVPQSLSITTADQIIAQGFDSISDIAVSYTHLTLPTIYSV